MSSMAADFSSMYDVFLSFRGDTRYGFTKHLHEALVKNQVKAFMDVVDLDKGEEINDALLCAIQKSKIAIIVFSKDFASSTWCLAEVVKIIECKDCSGMKVIPVFYNIDPTVVRKQIGPYGEAIAAHLRKYQNEVEKVNRWKLALSRAASISGWDTKNVYEADLIKSIVEDVSNKLKGPRLKESRSTSQTSTSRSHVFDDCVQSEIEVSDAEDIMPLHWFELAAALGRCDMGASTNADSASTVANSRKTGSYENIANSKWNDVVAKAAAASSTSGEEVELGLFDDYSRKYVGLEDSMTEILEMLHDKEKFGIVCSVALDDKIEVAVKRLKDVTLMSKQKFKSKISAVARMQHQNLVPLRGYYFSAEVKLLFYDYMPMSNLYAILHETKDKTWVKWKVRLDVALEAARGIKYVHSQDMSHGNITSSHILFAESFVVRVSDYCLADLVDPYSKLSTSGDGYHDPKVTDPHALSREADVYSFGILLIELVSGKNPKHGYWTKDKGRLPRWVASIDEGEWMYRVIDGELVRDADSVEEMVQILHLALECTAPFSYQRPTMFEVTQRIEEIQQLIISTSNSSTVQTTSDQTDRYSEDDVQTISEVLSEYSKDLRQSASYCSNIELVD